MVVYFPRIASEPWISWPSNESIEVGCCVVVHIHEGKCEEEIELFINTTFHNEDNAIMKEGSASGLHNGEAML